MAHTIKINRAPVLTLWGVVVAERLGYSHDEALTLGKVVAGLNAQSKGQRLGIYTKSEAELDEKNSQKAKEAQAGETLTVELIGRRIPVVKTKQGLRATAKGEEVKPQTVERYLEQKFGEELADVREALEELAKAYPPQELERNAYALYERFRPSIPDGVRGWGAAGDLRLDNIQRMAKKEAK